MGTALTLESEILAQTDLHLSAFVCHIHTKSRPQFPALCRQGTHRGCVTGIMGPASLLAWGASSSRRTWSSGSPLTEMAWPWAGRRRFDQTSSGFTTFSSLGSSLHCLVCSTPEGKAANGLWVCQNHLLPPKGLRARFHF